MIPPFGLYTPLNMSHLRHDTLILLCLSKPGARLGKFYMNQVCLNSQLSLPTNEFLEHVDVLGLADGVGGLLKIFLNQIERRQACHHYLCHPISPLMSWAHQLVRFNLGHPYKRFLGYFNDAHLDIISYVPFW